MLRQKRAIIIIISDADYREVISRKTALLWGISSKDVRITDVPLNFRRPDVTACRCIAGDERHTRRLVMDNPIPVNMRLDQLTSI
jgi:hypothetical protein